MVGVDISMRRGRLKLNTSVVFIVGRCWESVAVNSKEMWPGYCALFVSIREKLGRTNAGINHGTLFA